ncbi:hypothetical protein [Labrys wisconsinensis]|uniref:Uncharacterized protein n=1 Tax=Labrys wisconsinensis TaxID=425677 RepID=A0ABU0J3R9_9HYPH|nr:hypothetical protein [Labrys wisconsinensis]MDQ0468905.1 hypothetical protein [Labrys wisconsinensis]
MRWLFSSLMIVYLTGVAVQLSPIVGEQWDSVPASRLVASVADEIPSAVSWPVRAYESLRGRG